MPLYFPYAHLPQAGLGSGNVCSNRTGGNIKQWVSLRHTTQPWGHPLQTLLTSQKIDDHGRIIESYMLLAGMLSTPCTGLCLTLKCVVSTITLATIDNYIVFFYHLPKHVYYCIVLYYNVHGGIIWKTTLSLLPHDRQSCTYIASAMSPGWFMTDEWLITPPSLHSVTP